MFTHLPNNYISQEHKDRAGFHLLTSPHFDSSFRVVPVPGMASVIFDVLFIDREYRAQHLWPFKGGGYYAPPPTDPTFAQLLDLSYPHAKTEARSRLQRVATDLHSRMYVEGEEPLPATTMQLMAAEPAPMAAMAAFGQAVKAMMDSQWGEYPPLPWGSKGTMTFGLHQVKRYLRELTLQHGALNLHMTYDLPFIEAWLALMIELEGRIYWDFRPYIYNSLLYAITTSQISARQSAVQVEFTNGVHELRRELYDLRQRFDKHLSVLASRHLHRKPVKDEEYAAAKAGLEQTFKDHATYMLRLPLRYEQLLVNRNPKREAFVIPKLNPDLHPRPSYAPEPGPFNGWEERITDFLLTVRETDLIEARINAMRKDWANRTDLFPNVQVLAAVLAPDNGVPPDTLIEQRFGPEFANVVYATRT